uniref:Bile acid-CoA:amino acid N-acyltransferase n=1 Tax=Magallana gigas TaxID=29159 RepID=K1PCA8_MAGGI
MIGDRNDNSEHKSSIRVPKRQMSTGGIQTKGVPSTSIRTHTEVSTNDGSSFFTDIPTYNTETPTKKSLSTVTSTTTLAYQTTLVDASIGVPKRQMSTGGIEIKGVPSTSIRTHTEVSTNDGRGPFPGVIDIMGAAGGLFHYRGALLASKGFVVLCLSVYKYDDLPKKQEDVTFDYFIIKAVVLSSGVTFVSDYPLKFSKGDIPNVCF